MVFKMLLQNARCKHLAVLHGTCKSLLPWGSAKLFQDETVYGTPLVNHCVMTSPFSKLQSFPKKPAIFTPPDPFMRMSKLNIMKSGN